jgi:hypothetical protein
MEAPAHRRRILHRVPSRQFSNKPDDLTLLDRVQGRKCFFCYLAGDRYCLFGNTTPIFRYCDHAATAILGVILNRDQPPICQAMNHASDGGGIKMNQTSKMVL